MTLEERIQQMLGQQAFAILALQADVEKSRTQVANLEAQLREQQHANKVESPPEVPAEKLNGGDPNAVGA